MYSELQFTDLLDHYTACDMVDFTIILSLLEQDQLSAVEAVE